MWTAATRRHHSRAKLRYGSDLTDTEWARLAPFMPAPHKTGRPRRWAMREIVQAIFYVLRSGCTWRDLPKDFPPATTVYRWFLRFRHDGLFRAVNHRLVMIDRERMGREASPSAALIDSQSVKTAEAGGPCGFDAGKKIKGRKRHAVVDTDGRALVLQVHSAGIQDRDGAIPLLTASSRSFPFVLTAYVDGAYHAERVRTATSVTIQIVKKIAQQAGFQVLPRRWVVERFFAWINRNGRLAKDVEASIASATTFLNAASVMLLTRRLAAHS